MFWKYIKKRTKTNGSITVTVKQALGKMDLKQQIITSDNTGIAG